MSLPSHGHTTLSVITKLLIICNGTKKGSNTTIIIKLPIVFVLIIIFILVAEIYLLHDVYLWQWWNTYHVQVQTVWFFRKMTIKIADWGLLWRFQIFHCHRRPIPPPLRYLLSTNIRQCTGFSECICHQPPQNITHCGSEHLNWGGWWLVWDLLISFRRYNDLCNHSEVYFIIMRG